LQNFLGALEDVKDIHAERMLSLSLRSSSAPSSEPFQPCSTSTSNTSSTDDANDDRPQEQVVIAMEHGEALCATKRPGRLQTRSTFALEDNYLEDGFPEDEIQGTSTSALQIEKRKRRLLLDSSNNLASLLKVKTIWDQGHRGQGVRMGVFDTGIHENHPDVKNIKERSNWTHEPTLEDGLGHGSFVAGVIAGTSPSCPGLAPEVDLHTFRVFTNDQVSYTSWFLDAFNYAMATKMDVVNLSIGGPDHLDRPFVEKVQEVTSSGIIMVSAIGNDGPLYGTLNNPADQNDVIGVGGIDWSGNIAGFSSRGMSTWELPLGYGRSKPDVMAYGKEVQGSRIDGGCRSLSGTSVASPVVAGAVCLLASTVSEERRWILNPASMKQALIEGAVRLPDLNMYEQGQGQMNVLGAAEILSTYKPRASIVPATLNFTECPYAWPFCRQPLYAGAMPLIFNATILNGMNVVGKIEKKPTWSPTNDGGKLLDVRFEYPEQLWPWSGHLGIFLRVKPSGNQFTGEATGEITFTVVSPPGPGEGVPRRSKVSAKLIVEIIPTPPREKRVLWDQFHSIRYPPAYFPRDDLEIRHDILDWHGDHPHTNFHDMYNSLRDSGYFLEVLASPLTCFNAENYGALMIVDSEDEFYPEEIEKLEKDIRVHGLGLLVFADWYELESVKKMRFYDDNTRSWWEAATGGANVPALNDLLKPLGIAFAGGTHDVQVKISGIILKFRMASGSSLAGFPEGGYLHNASLSEPSKKKNSTISPKDPSQLPVLGLLHVGQGRVVVYGDSNCLDSSHQRQNCFDLLKQSLSFVSEKDDSQFSTSLLRPENRLSSQFGSLNNDKERGIELPERRADYNFTAASFVLQHEARCYLNSPLEYQNLSYQDGEENGSGVDEENTGEMSGNLTAAEEIDNLKEEEEKQQREEKDEEDGGGGGAVQERSEESSSRDIAAQQEGIQWRDDISIKETVGTSQDKGSAITIQDREIGADVLREGGSVSTSRLRFKRLPLQVVQFSQVFSIVGGIGLVVLWSLVRRRRPGSGTTGGGVVSSARRSSFLLPMFMRPGRGRRE
jgi:membrane-bound transcription factor site-1 protease